MQIEDLPPKYQRQVRRKLLNNKDRAAVQVADMESNTGERKVVKGKDKTHDTRCRCVVLARRKRWCDTDNISIKACLDGLVRGGVIQDDRLVEEVTISQVKCQKGQEEETIVELWRM